MEAVGGISDPQYAKLDKKEFEEVWKSSLRARLDAEKRKADAADDAIPVMLAMSGGCEGVGFGMPCVGCTLGGGMGTFC